MSLFCIDVALRGTLNWSSLVFQHASATWRCPQGSAKKAVVGVCVVQSMLVSTVTGRLLPPLVSVASGFALLVLLLLLLLVIIGVCVCVCEKQQCWILVLKYISCLLEEVFSWRVSVPKLTLPPFPSNLFCLKNFYSFFCALRMWKFWSLSFSVSESNICSDNYFHLA